MMKAIALVSGGLDSILAARLIKEQGIDVIAVNFKIPFCSRDKAAFSQVHKTAQLVKDALGEELKIVDVSEDFLKLLENPRYGFGSNMNPCIDCKIFMLSRAKHMMQELGAQFVITGEVLGQRPMSQHKNALYTIAKQAGLEGLLLRPLCAKLLFETIPETKGWVKREALLNLSGRGRRPQINLADKFGIKGFGSPAGGCLLTDKAFSARLKDLIAHKELNTHNVALLKVGRHFRVGSCAKLIVGHNEQENIELEKLACPGDYLFYPDEQLAGPTSLGRGKFDPELIELCGRITGRYCDLAEGAQAKILYKIIPRDEIKILSIPPLPILEAEKLRL